MIFSIFFYVRLSQPHIMGHVLVELTLFFYVFFILIFFSSFAFHYLVFLRVNLRCFIQSLQCKFGMLTRVKFFCSFLKLIFFFQIVLQHLLLTFAFLVIELQISFIFSLYEVTLLSLNFSFCYQIRLLIPFKNI